MIEKRYRAACVILNHQKTAWIVGGEGSAYAKTTTEFVTLNKTSVRGPDLSFEVYPTYIFQSSAVCTYNLFSFS